MRSMLAVLLAVLSSAGLFSWADSNHIAHVTRTATAVRYKINTEKSKFMVYANRAGVAYFKGKSHQIAVRDFDGEASLDLTALNPASLEMTVRSASLEETRDVYTPEQKGIINKELNEIVLETAKYPEITFKSTDIKGQLRNGTFDLKIGGDLTLHGITKHIVIPATVTIAGDTMQAKGEFKINRKNFHVNATEAFHGFVKVRHTIRFSFDIIADRI